MLAGPIEMSNKSLLSGSDGHKNNISFANINTFLCKINFWDYSHESLFPTHSRQYIFRTFLISLYVFFSNTYIKEWPFSGLFFCGVWWKTCCMYAVPFSFQEIELYCRECQLEQAFFHNYQAYTLHLLYFNSICNKE